MTSAYLNSVLPQSTQQILQQLNTLIQRPLSSNNEDQKTFWESFKSIPWNELQLNWDFADTTFTSALEIASLITDFAAKENDPLLTSNAILIGLAIGMLFAYCERRAHLALNKLIDTDLEERKDITTTPNSSDNLSYLQKGIISVETLTHTLEKASGVTQVARVGIDLLGHYVPSLAKFSFLAKGIAHAAILSTSLLASGQEALNIIRAFQHENAKNEVEENASFRAC